MIRNRRDGLEVHVPEAVNLWSERRGAVLLFGGRLLHGHHHVGIHQDDGARGLFYQNVSPAPLGACISLLRHEGGCASGLMRRLLTRVTPVEGKGDAPEREPLSHVPYSLEQKVVVTRGCTGIIGSENKKDVQRRSPVVGQVNRVLQCMVVLRAHRCLHPVPHGTRG